VERAGRATTPAGKRYHHQRRLPRALLATAARELKRARLGSATNFADLYRRVDAAIGALHGIGELTVYDTALRIGAKLGYLPKKVYLHAGTRAGARALGLDWKARSLPVRQLPVELRVLAPHEIEDCLCIFKDKLKSLV
jgi:imidazolonepropionase-like amidohydrolase